jgi:hypothetical protein
VVLLILFIESTFNFNVESKNGYINIDDSLKGAATVKATAEFVESTEWPPNYLDFNPLDCHVWNKFKH